MTATSVVPGPSRRRRGRRRASAPINRSRSARTPPTVMSTRSDGDVVVRSARAPTSAHADLEGARRGHRADADRHGDRLARRGRRRRSAGRARPRACVADEARHRDRLGVDAWGARSSSSMSPSTVTNVGSTVADDELEAGRRVAGDQRVDRERLRAGGPRRPGSSRAPSVARGGPGRRRRRASSIATSSTSWSTSMPAGWMITLARAATTRLSTEAGPRPRPRPARP